MLCFPIINTTIKIIPAKQCISSYNFVGACTLDDKFYTDSTGKAVAISIVITFIVTLAVTALITVIIISKYYKCQYELKKKVKVDSDDNDLTRHLIIMHKNPACVSSDKRLEVANYA